MLLAFIAQRNCSINYSADHLRGYRAGIISRRGASVPPEFPAVIGAATFKHSPEMKRVTTRELEIMNKLARNTRDSFVISSYSGVQLRRSYPAFFPARYTDNREYIIAQRACNAFRKYGTSGQPRPQEFLQRIPTDTSAAAIGN